MTPLLFQILNLEIFNFGFSVKKVQNTCYQMMVTKQALHKLDFENTLKYHQVALLMIKSKKIKIIAYISTADTPLGLVGVLK